jgi:RNA polymerase sigma factor (sigma-70 family)
MKKNQTDPLPNVDALVKQYDGLAEYLCRRYERLSEHDDIVQEARIGLLAAARKYDPSKGVKFATFAVHAIRGQIKHYFRDRHRSIRLPGYITEQCDVSDYPQVVASIDEKTENGTYLIDVADNRSSIDASDIYLRQMINGFKEPYRSFIKLYMRGFNQTEIARMTGYSQNHVSRRLSEIHSRIQLVIQES